MDILEGDAEGHVRFHTPEAAKAVCAAKARMQSEHGWKVEVLSGRLSSLVRHVSQEVTENSG